MCMIIKTITFNCESSQARWRLLKSRFIYRHQVSESNKAYLIECTTFILSGSGLIMSISRTNIRIQEFCARPNYQVIRDLRLLMAHMPEWLKSSETLLKTPILIIFGSKLFSNFHLLSFTFTCTKEVKALVKKKKVALSVLLHKSHKRKYISWLTRLSDLFKIFKTSPGGESGESRGRGREEVPSSSNEIFEGNIEFSLVFKLNYQWMRVQCLA